MKNLLQVREKKGQNDMSKNAPFLPRRKNLFQKAFSSWDEIIPYNATHAISFDAPLQEEALRDAIHRSLPSLGFPCSREQIRLREGKSGTDLLERVRATFEEEINRRFDPAEDILPFRFFWCQEDGESFVLGVSYFHAVASADCICWMFEMIVSCYLGKESKSPAPVSGRRPAPYLPMLLRQWWRFPAWAIGFPRFIKQIKSYARLSGRLEKRAQSRIHTLPLNEAQLSWLRETSKRTGATVNDVFMGLLMYGLGKELPDRFSRGRRNQLAIGSIINIRNHFGANHQTNFGVYLAIFSVSCPISSLNDLDDILREVRRQTLEIKKGYLYLRSLLLIATGVFHRHFLDEEGRAQNSRKNFPLAAGITNFFVDRFQGDLKDLPISEYWRAVSVSPATPLILSLTTFRNQTCLMFIRDNSLYSKEEIESVISRITQSMR